MEERFAQLLNAVMLRYEAAGLDPTKTLVILSTTDNYSPLVDAYYSAAVALGADPVLITYKSRPPISGLPDAIIAMAAQADQVVDLHYKTSSYTDSLHELHRRLTERPGHLATMYGGRLDGHSLGWEEDMNYIINCPPSKEVAERVERARKMIDAAKEIRITSDLGTDLTVARGSPAERASYTHFPPGQVAISPPEDGVSGVVYFVGGFRTNYPFPVVKRMVYEPVKMEVEKGKLVRIHRDNEVGMMLDEWFKARNDPNTYQFAHINLGLDPRAVLEDLDNISTHFHYGGILMGFGANNMVGWGSVQSKGHIDMALVGADYLVDGGPILKGGEFTVHSGLRAPGRG